MATYVNDLRLKEIATGDESGTWGTSTNTNLELIAEAFSFGTEAITTNADTHTTTIADGSTDPGRSLYLKYTGTLDSACTITIGPNTVSKLWFIENGTSGSQNIIISQGSGANITIPPGDTKAIYSDGAGSGAAMVDAFASLSVVDLKVQDDLTVTDDLIVNGDIDLEGSIDVNGTANLDVVDIDGALTQDGGAVFNEDSADVDFRVESNGEANMLFVNGGDNTVLIGSSTSIANSAGTGALQVLGTGGGDTTLTIGRFSANASPPTLEFTKSRNATIGSNTIIQDGDNLGQIVFSASDGNDMLSSAAKIEVEVDGTPGADDLPGRMGFYTTPDGGTGSTERMRISNDGKIGISVTAEQILHIKDTSNPDTTTGSVIIEGQRDGTANLLELRALDNSSSSGALPNGQGGIVRFTGFDGTDFEELANISANADGQAVANNDSPGRLVFGTTADTDGSSTEKVRITSGGFLGVGTTSPSTQLHVAATNNSAGDLYTAVGAGNVPSLTIQNAGTTDNNNAGIFFRDNDGMRSSVAARFVNHSTNETQLRISTTNSSGSTAERWIFEGNGNFKPIANGTGINFDASEGGSASSTVLDDYEEGTWTPTDSSGASLSFAASGGRYTKIGNKVFFVFRVQYPSTTNSANARIGGLPYTGVGSSAANLDIAGGATIALAQNFNAGYSAYVEQGNTTMYLFKTNEDQATIVVNATLSGQNVYMFGQYTV